MHSMYAELVVTILQYMYLNVKHKMPEKFTALLNTVAEEGVI